MPYNTSVEHMEGGGWFKEDSVRAYLNKHPVFNTRFIVSSPGSPAKDSGNSSLERVPKTERFLDPYPF